MHILYFYRPDNKTKRKDGNGLKEPKPMQIFQKQMTDNANRLYDVMNKVTIVNIRNEQKRESRVNHNDYGGVVYRKWTK